MHRTEQKTLMAQVRNPVCEKHEIKIFFLLFLCAFLLFIALVFILFVGAFVL